MSWLSILALALQTAIGFQGASYALAASGLNLQFGYTGLSNFGHVGHNSILWLWWIGGLWGYTGVFATQGCIMVKAGLRRS